LNQGKKKLLDKNYTQAIKLFSESLNLDPNNVDAKFFRALSILDSGSYKEAIEELNEVL